MADLYINPKGYVVDKSTQPITGNQKIDSYLSELPAEERDAALKELQAPLTGEEVAQMLHEDASWKPNKQQFDAFSAYQAHKETSLFDAMGLFSDAASGIYSIAGNVVASMYDHPLEDAVKLAPSLLEGGVQNIRNWYGMLAQSQDPNSVLFKFKNALARDGSISAYEQFLQAREFAKDSIDYESGKKTILVNKDYIDPALTQAATIIVDPMFYGSFLVGAGEVGLAHKAAQILGMSERLAKASVFAEKMKGAVYGGALKYGVGVPLEFIGDITRGAIDKTLEGGSKLLEGATGVSAQELKQAAKIGGFGSIGFGVPYISPTSKVYLGAGFAGRLGEAISATGEQILKNQGKRGLLSFAEQAIAESDAMLAKGGAGLTPQARKLLGIINKVDPMFSYAGAFMEGGAHGAVIGAGLGALGGGEEGAWSGAGAGFGIGSMGGVAGRALSNVGGGLEKQRLAVQMDMLMPMLKDIDPTKHSTIDLIRKANRAAGNPDWVVDRYIVALDKIAPDTRMFAGGAKDNEAVLRARGQDPKIYDGFERDAKGDYILDKDGNKVKLRDAEGYSIPTMAEYESAGWTIQEGANGKIKIHINTDKLGDLANTLPHEMFHGIFRELGMKPEFQNRINEHILGTFDANGKQIKPPSISKYEAESFFTKYINNAYTGTDKAERITKLKEALNEYYTTGKMTVIEADGKTPVLSHLTEEFGAFYWTQFLNDKPVDYLFRGGDLGGMRNVLDSVKNKWQDYMERKVGGVNGGFDFARSQYLNPSFLDKNGKRIRVGALDYMMQDLIRTKSAASKGQAFDFNTLSPDGQRAYVEASGNSVAFEPPAVKGGKYKVRSEAQQAKIRAKNGQAMHTGLEGFRTSNPEMLRIKDAQGNDIGGLSVDADGNYVGTVPDAIIDYFVKSGHIDKVEGERIRILQQAARGETTSNVFEFSDYTGATMHTGVGVDVRAVSPNVPTKDRLVILTDFSVKISNKDYGFYAHTLDYRHLQLRVDNSWKDPKVRAAWGDDRDAFVSDLFRYFKNASQPDGKRLPSAQLWSVDGEYKRNIMHDVSGIQTPASGTINTANAPIAGDMFSTFRKFRTDRMTQERMSGEKIDLRGDNAIDYIRHNMMPSEMSHEATPAGDGVWVHPNGYKFFKTNKGIKAVKEDGTRIGTFNTIEEATKAADIIYQKENPAGKPIPSIDNIRKEPLDVPENQEQFVQRKIDSFYERPENALDLLDSKEFENFFEKKGAFTLDKLKNTVKSIIDDANKPNQGDRFSTDFIDYPISGDEILSQYSEIDFPKAKTIGDIFKEFYKEQFFKEQEANNPTFVSGLSVALDKILPANVNKEGTIQASRLINLIKSASGGDIGKILTEANAIGFTDYLKSKGQQRIAVSEIKDFIDKNGIKVSIDPRTDIRGNEWQGGGFDTSRYVAEGKKDGYYTFVARINPEQAHGVEGHFGGDTIAHIRATIRTDAQGRKVLFVEEIQSINTNAGVLSPEGRIKAIEEYRQLKKWDEETINFYEEVDNVRAKYKDEITELLGQKTDAKLSIVSETREQELARNNYYQDRLNKIYDKRANDWRKVWEQYKNKIEPKYKEIAEKEIKARNKRYGSQIENDKVLGFFYNLQSEIQGETFNSPDYTRRISEIESKLSKKKNDKPLQDFNETVKIASRTIMRKAVELGAERVVLVRPEDMHPDVSKNAEGERFVDAAYGTDIPMMINAELKKYGQKLSPARNFDTGSADTWGGKLNQVDYTKQILSESLGYDITPEMKQKASRSQTFMMPSEGRTPLFERKEFKDFASGTRIINQTQQEFVVQKLQKLLLPENKQQLQKLIKGSYDNYGTIFRLLDEYEKIKFGGKIKHELTLSDLESSGDYINLKEYVSEINRIKNQKANEIIEKMREENPGVKIPDYDPQYKWIEKQFEKLNEIKAELNKLKEQGFNLGEIDYQRYLFENKHKDGANLDVESLELLIGDSFRNEYNKQIQTGEPVTVIANHGTPNKELVQSGEFDVSKLGENTGSLSAKNAVFFAGSDVTSSQYVGNPLEHNSSYYTKTRYPELTKLLEERLNGVENTTRALSELRKLQNEVTKDSYLSEIERIYSIISDENFSLGSKGQMWKEAGKKPYLMRYAIKFKNPYVYEYSKADFRDVKYAEVLDIAKAQGHDGVVFKNTRDGGGTDIIYALFPENSKTQTKLIETALQDKAAYRGVDESGKEIKSGRQLGLMYMPSEGEQGGRKYTAKQLKSSFIGKQAQENPELTDGVRLSYRGWDDSEGSKEGRKTVMLTRSSDGAEIGRIDFNYTNLTKHGMKSRGFGDKDGIVIDGINVNVNKRFQGKGYQHILYSEMYERARAMGATGFSQEIENAKGLPLKSVNKVIGEENNYIASLSEPSVKKPTQENFNKLIENAPEIESNYHSNLPSVQNWGNIDLRARYMPAEQAQAWRKFESERVSDGNSIYRNAMNFVIIQANNKFKVYNPQKALLGIYTDLEEAKKRVRREEPKPR